MKVYIKKIEYCNQCPNAWVDPYRGKYVCKINKKFINSWLNDDSADSLIYIPEWCDLPDETPNIVGNYKIQLPLPSPYRLELKHDLKLTNVYGETINWEKNQEFEIVENDIIKLPFFHIIPVHFGRTSFLSGKRIPLTDKTIQDHFIWLTNNNPFPPPEYIDKEEFEI